MGMCNIAVDCGIVALCCKCTTSRIGQRPSRVPVHHFGPTATAGVNSIIIYYYCMLLTFGRRPESRACEITGEQVRWWIHIEQIIWFPDDLILDDL